MNEHNKYKIEVCSECLRASCWQGDYLCMDAITSGTVKKKISDLIKLNLEHPAHWKWQIIERYGKLPNDMNNIIKQYDKKMEGIYQNDKRINQERIIKYR